MKKVSAGVIITDFKDILIGHTTGMGKYHSYDIFKGWVWFNIENHKSAALRELKEESGIILKPTDLLDLGTFKYRSNKDLHLFLYKSTNVKKEFDIKKLSCSSIVPIINYPEIDRYKICSIFTVQNYMHRKLYEIVSKILKEYKVE